MQSNIPSCWWTVVSLTFPKSVLCFWLLLESAIANQHLQHVVKHVFKNLTGGLSLLKRKVTLHYKKPLNQCQNSMFITLVWSREMLLSRRKREAQGTYLQTLNLFHWFKILDANVKSNQEPNVCLTDTPEIILQKQIRWSIQSLDPLAFLLFPITQNYMYLHCFEGSGWWTLYILEDLDHHILRQDKISHSWEWKLGHLKGFTPTISFPLTVLEI